MVGGHVRGKALCKTHKNEVPVINVVSGITFRVKFYQASFFIFNGDQYFMSGSHFKTLSGHKATLKKIELGALIYISGEGLSIEPIVASIPLYGHYCHAKLTALLTFQK